MFLQTRVQTKKDSQENWETKNPILLDGELVIVTLTGGGQILRQEMA